MKRLGVFGLAVTRWAEMTPDECEAALAHPPRNFRFRPVRKGRVDAYIHKLRMPGFGGVITVTISPKRGGSQIVLAAQINLVSVLVRRVLAGFFALLYFSMAVLMLTSGRYDLISILVECVLLGGLTLAGVWVLWFGVQRRADADMLSMQFSLEQMVGMRLPANIYDN